MMPTRQGSFRLFRFAGIQVFLHWSWILVAVYQINTRAHEYPSFIWCALEYVALFAIVLLHEFGHALACRQVGGKAEQIVLWPLGGVAYVAPPQRPAATLWSIAAGPLVNVLLAPALTVFTVLGSTTGWADTQPNLYHFVEALCLINYAILIFNLLPIYPLDGGQMLRSVLWFFLGRARSLLVTSVVGFLGVVALLGFALWSRSVWMGILAVFILLNCWRGLMEARLLARADRLPRHPGYACPECKQAPVAGLFSRCGRCFQAFDSFQTQALCPYCGTQSPPAPCLECGALRPFQDWMLQPVVNVESIPNRPPSTPAV